MWICAACGTQAQVPDMCSGCGSMMKPFGEPKEVNYQFVLICPLDKGFECIGPFESVLAADMWWDEHRSHDAKAINYEVVLMEVPDDEAQTA